MSYLPEVFYQACSHHECNVIVEQGSQFCSLLGQMFGCVLVAGVGRRWSQWNHLGIHDELEVAPVYSQ